MINNEIKMAALNDDALECVVGGSETDEELHELSMKHAKQEADNVIRFFESIINFFRR